MKRLADSTREGVKDLASLIRKQRVLNIAPLPDRFIVFPANGVRMVFMLATIAKNMERVSRNIVPADLLAIMRDVDRLEMHEQQIEIEKDQDNSLGESYFAPLTEKTVYERGFKTWHDNAKCALEDIRGEASGVPLTYLICPNVHPLPEAAEPEANFDTFNEQLMASKPIVKHARRNAPEADYEDSGPSWKRPKVNADNHKLHALILKAAENTSWRVHLEPTMNAKDGRKTWFLLCLNLQTRHEVKLKSKENMAKLCSLN